MAFFAGPTARDSSSGGPDEQKPDSWTASCPLPRFRRNPSEKVNQRYLMHSAGMVLVANSHLTLSPSSVKSERLRGKIAFPS